MIFIGILYDSWNDYYYCFFDEIENNNNAI